MSGLPNDDVFVVVPMFNEAARIGPVVTELLADFPVVVCVDDGGTDESGRVAEAAGATVVRHPVNLGQGAALQTGFAYALDDPRMRYVVTFDADGQHRPADAVSMVATARLSGVDVVLGSRFLECGNDADVPWLRRAVLRLATRFTRATTGLALTDTHNGLRVLKRSAVASLDLTLNGMAHASQMLEQIARQGLTYTEAPVTITYTEYSRAHGQSNVNALNIAFDLAMERLRGAH